MFCKIFFYSNPDPKSASWKKHEVFWLDHGYGGFNHGMPSRIWAVHCPKSNPNFRYKTWNVEENEIWNILRTVVQYHVFPATFHVISRKMYYLWDSVCLASALYICTLYCTYEYVDKSQTYIIASSPVIGVFLCGVSEFWHIVTRRKNVGFLPGITF